MKKFYDTGESSHYIRNKLIAVDNLGIWVEGFSKTKLLYDDDMNKIENPVSEWVTYHVVIRWEYLQGVFVVDNPEVYEKKMGFIE